MLASQRLARPVHLALTLLVLPALAACSPYGLRGPAEGFSKATSDVFTAMDAGQREVAGDRTALLRVQVGDGRVNPVRTGACEPVFPREQLGRCRIVPPGEERRPVRGELTAEQMQRLRGMERYAQSLLALTNAADREAMNAASAKVAAAVGTMAAAAAPAAPAAMIAGPVAQFGLFLLGEALDHERYLRLQEAVREAHPQLLVLAPTLQRHLVFLRDERVALLGRASQLLVAGIRTEGSAAARAVRLDQAANQVARINALQDSDPVAVIADLIRAHERLRDALTDRSAQMEALAQAIGDFSAQAQRLKAAFQSTSQQGA